MNRSLLLFFPVFFFLCSVYSCSGQWLDKHIIDEVEPNELTYQANEIEEGNTYRGRIAHPVKDVTDTDLFKIWKPSGTVIVFEFESDDVKFRPYVGHTSGSGQAEFALFNTPGRYSAEFPTAVSGWHYFEVGDMRNVFDDKEKFGGFTYYFRVSSYHVCHDSPSSVLAEEDIFEGVFLDSYGNVETVVMKPQDNGYHQIDLISGFDLVSDKYMFVYDCDGRQTIIGNDDEDYYSRKYDPLIYGSFQKDSNYVLISGRILADLRTPAYDPFRIELNRQLPDREMEPNNTNNYANRTGYGPVYGELSLEPVMITGNTGDDVDIFKYSFQKGELINFRIETDVKKEFMAQFWIGSPYQTGSMVLPMRFSSLSGMKSHNVNMFMPFTGSGYLFLEGRGVPYTFFVEKEDEIIKIEASEEGEIREVFDTPDCKWVFAEWEMPEDGDLFQIKVEGENSSAGYHIFSTDNYPYAFVDPAENNRFFVHRYEKTEKLVLGMYFSNCDQEGENIMELTIEEEELNHNPWINGFSSDPVKVSANGAYQGYIDTDNYFVENIFAIDVWEDGKLFLTTATDITSLTDIKIDTVVSLLKDNTVIAKNDNMIDFMNYNKYSYLTYNVKKGEKYRVKVSPFMSESSHIPSMNIIGNYILDIRIK